MIFKIIYRAHSGDLRSDYCVASMLEERLTALRRGGNHVVKLKIDTPINMKACKD